MPVVKVTTDSADWVCKPVKNIVNDDTTKTDLLELLASYDSKPFASTEMFAISTHKNADNEVLERLFSIEQYRDSLYLQDKVPLQLMRIALTASYKDKHSVLNTIAKSSDLPSEVIDSLIDEFCKETIFSLLSNLTLPSDKVTRLINTAIRIQIPNLTRALVEMVRKPHISDELVIEVLKNKGLFEEEREQRIFFFRELCFRGKSNKTIYEEILLEARTCAATAVSLIFYCRNFNTVRIIEELYDTYQDNFILKSMMTQQDDGIATFVEKLRFLIPLASKNPDIEELALYHINLEQQHHAVADILIEEGYCVEGIPSNELWEIAKTILTEKQL